MSKAKSSLRNKLVSGHRFSNELFIGSFLTVTLFLFLLPILSALPAIVVQVLAQPVPISNNNNNTPTNTTASASIKTQSNQTDAINDQLNLIIKRNISH